MLQITIPGRESFNEMTQEFFKFPDTTLKLEHSLLSISKWESKWKKPFLKETDQKTLEETTDYIRCMTLNQGVDPRVYYCLTAQNQKDIQDYIGDKKTATWFSKTKMRGGAGETVTSELIYYWMIALGIPFECEKWHLSRLLTLIEICNRKNAPAQKMSRRDLYAQNRSLNAARRKAHHSKG